MKHKQMIALALCLVLVAVTHGQGTQTGFDRGNLDESCAPCQDFYGYVNGGWMKKNPIPPAFGSWGVPARLNEDNREALHQMLEAAAARKNAPAGSSAQKTGDFYASCMDTQAIEAAGTKPLEPYLAAIKKIRDVPGLLAMLTQFQRQGLGGLFGAGVGPDQKNSTMNIATIGQGGLSLPDRDYYLKTDDKSRETRAEFLKHVTNMFELLGDATPHANAQANTILAIETRLAEASMDRVTMRNPLKTYNKKTLAELQALTKNIAWDRYFKDLGHPEIKEIIVRQPDYLQAMDRQLTETPIPDWQVYFRWRVLTAIAGTLPARFADENFRFYSTYLQGVKEQLPRWRQCVSVVDGNLGEALGQEYVRKFFPPAAKTKMQEMIDNLLAVLREDLGQVEWMSEATRRQAIEKLGQFTPRIGHPDKWQDYSQIKISRASYRDNLQRTAAFFIRDNWNKAGKPVDPAQWPFSPPTLNAGYLPTANAIFFPAGILQPPFFDFNAEDALNYGAIGAVIGHEIGHGFDNNGRRYDGKGNLRDWWTADDAMKYEERASCIEQLYSGFQALEGLNVNGKLTLGEAIGDLVGLRMSWRAWKKSLAGKPAPPVVDGFTAGQRFFLGFGRVWAQNQRPETLRLQIQTDPHAPGRFRANGTLMNMPEFAEAFGCKTGDKMVRAPRCVIW
ncbi:MAG: M13 family metallopeptidase [Blastocatellia bacterium]